jgi:hypothetical protein
MKRIFTSVLFASAIGLAVAACDSGDDDYNEAYGGGGGGYGDCAAATTCGACTPLNGCGWCFNSDGVGTCTSGPDQCTTPEFSWTWDPSGCRETADAGVVSPDAGASALDGGMEADSASSTDDGATDDAPAESGATP